MVIQKEIVGFHLRAQQKICAARSSRDTETAQARRIQNIFESAVDHLPILLQMNMGAPAAAAVGVGRMHSALSALDDTNQALHMELGSSLVMFKMVAEDLEAENETEMVEELGNMTKQIITLMNEFECHNKALQSLRETYTIENESTDFERTLAEQAHRYKGESTLDPEEHPYYKQFKETIWKVHRAGELMPGQEKEDLVITCTQYNVVNTQCPISGKPVIELDDPVRSTDCLHIYDRRSVMDYIKKWTSRRPCPCAAAGCPKPLVADRLVCDPMLKIEIQELRMRGHINTQVRDIADCTDLDDQISKAFQ